MQSRRFEYPPPPLLPFSFCSRCGELQHLASVLIAHFGMPCAFIFQHELIILSAKPCRYTTTCYSISNAFCWAFNLCAAHITLHQAAKLRSGTRVDLFPVPVIRQTRIPYTPVCPPLREWWCGALGITSLPKSGFLFSYTYSVRRRYERLLPRGFNVFVAPLLAQRPV